MLHFICYVKWLRDEWAKVIVFEDEIDIFLVHFSVGVL